MARWRIAVLVVAMAGFAGFIGFVSTPTANSDAWSTITSAPDSVLASLAKTPQTVATWAGTTFSSSSLFNLPGGYNTVAAGGVTSDFEAAAVATEFTINPWALVVAGGFLAMSSIATYISYQNGSQYYHWSSSSLGTNASGVLYLPRLVAVTAGQSVCVGESPSGGTVSWTASSDGYVLEANVGSGWCSSAWGPVAWDGSSTHVWIDGVSTGSVSEATVAQDHGDANTNVGAKLQFMSGNAQIWFLATPLGSAPPGFQLDNVTTSSISTTLNCTGSGFNGFGCTGSAFKTASPTDAQLADALRNVLATDAPSQNVVACYITGTCPTTAVAPYFSMPDCYGFSTSDCEAAMNGLGFTGTLNDNEADAPDYTQPAGVVISTDPAASEPVSTARATTATARTNPKGCATTRVDNPHWSQQSDGGTGSMLSYVMILCNFTGEATYNASMYVCTSDPGVDGQNLAAAGCSEVATKVDYPVSVQQGVQFQAFVPWPDPPGNDPAVPCAPAYWIATAVTTTADVINGGPQWSQDDWEPVCPS